VKTKAQSWDEVTRALEGLDAIPESAAEMRDALSDANGTIEMCKRYSLRLQDLEIVKFNPSSYAFPHAKAVLELASRDGGVTVGARHYGQGRYTWYLRLGYSEERLRDCLEMLPVSPEQTARANAKHGSLNDVIGPCKSFDHPARQTTIYFDPAKRYVSVTSSYGAGDYRGSDGYHIRKLSTDGFAWVATSTTS
jgi:hypothetical protein